MKDYYVSHQDILSASNSIWIKPPYVPNELISILPCHEPLLSHYLATKAKATDANTQVNSTTQSAAISGGPQPESASDQHFHTYFPSCVPAYLVHTAFIGG